AVHDPIHHPDILGETPSRRLEASGDAYPLVNRALRVNLSFTVEALQARNVMERNHPVAGTETRNFGANRCDHACGLVPINPRRSQQVMLDLLEVGVANATRFDPDQEFAWTDLRSRYFFDSDYAFAAIDGGVHGWRHRVQVRIAS